MGKKNISEFVFDEDSEKGKIQQVFEFLDSSEYLDFHNVKEKFTNRPDLHAFILIDKLVPCIPKPGPTDHNPFIYGDMIGDAQHDEFYLSVDIRELEEVITIEQIVDLQRCGVMYNKEYDCLYMFA